MRVFKFGGASVKDPQSVQNVSDIIRSHHGSGPLVVVLSAMGKTTNALERVCSAFMEGRQQDMMDVFYQIRASHMDIVGELFPEKGHFVYQILKQSFYQLEVYLSQPPGKDYNYEYDRIVSVGEIISTQILSAYLQMSGLANQWFPAQKLIITDAHFRDARVDWIATSQTIRSQLLPFLKSSDKDTGPHLVITQGFLGGTPQGFTTTLGREGSDYTAAILAYSLNASEVVIWKDVPGLLNADPKRMENPLLLKNISYQEAIELAYYGATVIHPKTLKPLLSRNIPLRVKSFTHPNLEGSLINNNPLLDNEEPSYIFKQGQVLASLFPKDFSFIAEDNLAKIFADFAQLGVKINLMQNSAISFSVCFDQDKTKTPALMRKLSELFQVKYNDNLELITVRHYEKANLDLVIQQREVIMEQKSRTTLQIVVKP